MKQFDLKCSNLHITDLDKFCQVAFNFFDIGIWKQEKIADLGKFVWI